MQSARLREYLRSLDLDQDAVPELDSWRNFLTKLEDSFQQLDHERAYLEQHALTSANAIILGHLVGGISHEINNPLATIQLRSDQLLEMIAADNIQKEFFIKSLTSVTAATQKISDSISTVRSILKQGAEDIPTFCSLQAILTETLALYKHKFLRNGVALNLHCDTDIVVEFVAADLMRILTHLLANAFDAVTTLDQKWVTVTASKNENDFIITVTDSGSGIDPTLTSQILTPFFSTKKTANHVGIGLFLVQEIISKYQGSLSLDVSNKNTQFKIIAPLVQYQKTQKAV